jgi:hypothetical protein
MTTPRKVSIDTLGERIARRITGLEGLKTDVESERQDIGSDLRHIWEALKSGQTVNGATNKKEWCAFAKITPRYAQYLVRDGSRKGQGTRTTVRVITLKEGMVVNFDGVKYVIERASLHKTTTSLILKPQLPSQEEVDKRLKKMTKLTKKERQAKASPKVNVGFMLFSGKPNKTHQMQPNDVRTYCGKTPGQTLKKDAGMSESPTCKQCQIGKYQDKARKEMAEAQQPKQSEKDLRKRLKQLMEELRECENDAYRVTDYLALKDQERQAIYPDLTMEKVDAHHERSAKVTKEISETVDAIKALQHPAAKALAAAVDGAEVPQICEQKAGVESYDND